MKKNFLNKREQSQARLSYAECEKSRLKARLFSLLVLLMTAVSGAWAQSTTHVVKQDKVNTIFSGDGYTLGNDVKAGDVLDFQGTIELEGDASHSLVINKPVNIISSTKDAVLKLHTPAGDRTGKNPGSTFVINADGAGTQVKDIRLENTGMWIFNTSNVTFTGVTFHVEGASVCSGLGHVALRYSDHITFDGCTVYTKNNGGSSACALTGSHDCTFKDTRFENAGNVGNVMYIGNPYNIQDKPADYTMNNDNISVLNCTFTAESSGGLSNFQIVGGLRHRIENCTVNFATGFGCNATASEDGHVIRNNTFTNGLKVPRASTVTGNTINGNVTIIANNATVSGTTVFPGSTITGNSILGKVTFNSNSKNNTFTGNTVISSEAYAVVMASTADANNTVTDNILLAASNAGDAAVNPSTGTGNTISNNLAKAYDYELTVAKSDHGTGTVKFFIDEKEVKGAYQADEGKTVTMTVTPEEGYVVGPVSANAYTTWAGARRTAPAAIPMLGNVTLTPVESKANTWTFTMPAASVELKIGYLVTSNLYLSKDALADKANITVKDGETTVEFDDDGKSTTTVIEGNTVTTKYNGTKKILGMKVAKKSAAPKLLNFSPMGQIFYYYEGETWGEAIRNHPENAANGWSIVEFGITVTYNGRALCDNAHEDDITKDTVVNPNGGYMWGPEP